jgi:hypothetical protein
MPRINIDYTKTIIYKLVCKDVSKEYEIYIGHTTNWNERKRNHRSCCNNEKVENYNLRLYKYIRENGGFDNWTMIEVETYPCETKRQAEIRERYWIEQLRATLNCIIPSRSKSERSRVYRIENKKIISDKAKEKITCECGCIVSRSSLTKHLQLSRHLKYMEKQPSK